MMFFPQAVIVAYALQAAAAPIEVEKRQLPGLGSTGSIPSLPTGGLGGSESLGSLDGGSSGGLGGLSGLSGGSSGLSGLSGLGGLTSGAGGSLMPSGTAKKRQSFGSLGSFTGGTGSSSGFGGLGSGTSSSSSGLSGFDGLSGLGSSSGLSGLGASSSGLSGLGATSTGSSSSASTGTSASTGSSGGGSGCRALTLVFARGTGEMGTMGTVVGPPLTSALESALGADQVTSEGVDYPADAGGNANMGASGGPAMASQAQAALSSCPDTKLVLAGYSQGAMVVHNALKTGDLDGSKVAAVVAFGDPFNGQAFEGVDASKVKEFCGSGDFLCSSGGTTGSGTHLNYGSDAEAAAQFIVGAVGL